MAAIRGRGRKRKDTGLKESPKGNLKKISLKAIGTKGIGIGQVFVFIVAAITFALIMIFGYKAVTDFLQKGEDVQFYQFKTDLESSLRRIYTEFGAVRTEEFFLPSGYSQVCFVDLDAPFREELCQSDAVACTIWQNADGYDSVDENVFLKPSAPVKIKVYPTRMEGGFLCLPIRNGFFELRLEGRGSYARLSLPQG